MQRRSGRWEEWDEIPELRAADLRGISAGKRKLLRITLELLKNCTGSTSPFEDHIERQIHTYAYFTPTPDEVEQDMETFRDDFEGMLEDSKQFIKQYPDMFAEGVAKTEGAPKREQRDDAPKSEPNQGAAKRPKQSVRPISVPAYQKPAGAGHAPELPA